MSNEKSNGSHDASRPANNAAPKDGLIADKDKTAKMAAEPAAKAPESGDVKKS